MSAARPRRPDFITVEELRFALRWSRRRRTVGITVHRDGGLSVAAPWRAQEAAVSAALRSKLPWVRRKLAEFAALGPPPRRKALQEGERLPYLGRTHRLVIVQQAASPFALRRGRFELHGRLDGRARSTVVEWYMKRAAMHIRTRIDRFAPLLGAEPSDVVVRDLGRRRWGTCHSTTGVLTFHWELVLQPRELIDYVVVHELAHLLAADHSPAFWRHVEGVIPDWKARRRRLATEGHRHVL